MEDLLLEQMTKFEKDAFIEKLIYNFKKVAPLERYFLYLKLKKLGVNMPYV